MQRPNPNDPDVLDRLPTFFEHTIRNYADARGCDVASALKKARDHIGDHAEATLVPQGRELLARQEAAKRLEVTCLRYVRARHFEGVEHERPQLEGEADLHAEIEARKEELEELEQEIAVRDRKIEGLQSTLEEKERAIDEAHEDLAAAEERFNMLSEEVDALHDENDDLIVDIQKVEDENERLREKLSEAEDRIQELESGAESDNTPTDSPTDHDEDDESAPESVHEWQTTEQLAEKLDKSVHAIGVAAGHYARGNDVDPPIERKSPDEKLFRVVPEEERGGDEDAPSDDDEPAPDDAPDGETVSEEDATYLVGDEVPGGVVLDKAKDSLESAHRYASSEYTDDTCDPVILQVVGAVPKLEQRLKWGVIESKDNMEVVQ